ncbi:Zn-ribbon domain-containing OB-fold protein [Sphingomonas sp. TF3]|uniref:Zn-ribbon domain-containing OB-fold protein n=1 Tax=Sphingomonas sp. TF3 TaxID=2495580 RepID=UPI000F86BFA0|nr:Zn-ribbon domain-containing OB-fold protein [Sphingomonas sp. TF3]RUN78384.1 Zn-ribbon domain-containing OB-fold protein [Sphingomonas sp. TF3]
MASTAPRFDLPTIEAETRPFWDALRQGVLMLGRCDSCARIHYYPRPMCPHCWSEAVTLVPAGGRGTLYTWSTVFVNDLPPFNAKLPYIAAQVDLDEGVRVTTIITGAAPEDLSIGMPVEVGFEAISDDVTIPVFSPAGS